MRGGRQPPLPKDVLPQKAPRLPPWKTHPQRSTRKPLHWSGPPLQRLHLLRSTRGLRHWRQSAPPCSRGLRKRESAATPSSRRPTQQTRCGSCARLWSRLTPWRLSRQNASTVSRRSCSRPRTAQPPRRTLLQSAALRCTRHSRRLPRPGWACSALKTTPTTCTASW